MANRVCFKKTCREGCCGQRRLEILMSMLSNTRLNLQIRQKREECSGFVEGSHVSLICEGHFGEPLNLVVRKIQVFSGPKDSS